MLALRGEARWRILGCNPRHTNMWVWQLSAQWPSLFAMGIKEQYKQKRGGGGDQN